MSNTPNIIAIARGDQASAISYNGVDFDNYTIPTSKKWEFAYGDGGSNFVYSYKDLEYPSSLYAFGVGADEQWHIAELPDTIIPCIIAYAYQSSRATISFGNSAFKYTTVNALGNNKYFMTLDAVSTSDARNSLALRIECLALARSYPLILIPTIKKITSLAVSTAIAIGAAIYSSGVNW